MKNTHRKALHFLTALADVYRSEDNRELEAFSKLDVGDDFTDDVIAILLALHLFVESKTSFDGDLIDLTHMLNKLAVQHIMGRQEGDPDE